MDTIYELSEHTDTTVFYGINNANMLLLKELHPNLRIMARGNIIKINGSDTDNARLIGALEQLEAHCLRYNRLETGQIIDIIKGESAGGERPEHLIVHGVNGKSIIARTDNQRHLAQQFQEADLLFAIGPAGSGKTYTAIALAVKALKEKAVRRIILSRPAVEAGEKLGFLPGDMKEKIDPYLQPLYDALQDMIPPAKLQDYMANGTIQIAPLAFMRGRTLSDAVVILDEAQNTTVPQIKMFLTRMGLNTKIIVTGDMTQIDLPAQQKSGLRDALDTLRDIQGIARIDFNQKDIVRHRLVQRIVEAYERQAAQQQRKRIDQNPT